MTKVVLPTFILERRSLLEMYADFFAHPDMFVGIPDAPTPRDRIVSVLRYILLKWTLLLIVDIIIIVTKISVFILINYFDPTDGISELFTQVVALKLPKSHTILYWEKLFNAIGI